MRVRNHIISLLTFHICVSVSGEELEEDELEEDELEEDELETGSFASSNWR